MLIHWVALAKRKLKSDGILWLVGEKNQINRLIICLKILHLKGKYSNLVWKLNLGIMIINFIITILLLYSSNQQRLNETV